ncbi:ribose-5-phosphate isomerase RpiA [Frigidibacter sp. RF13]|uniref:ribose-5-phosphate isomerase RpiA n=1 Tax=Frigidibacter sp. RF13 TaxID=2997340 RepID=UPI00226F9128|nr:ribose-5-phosphate isomerase RpiA [Frigidibacter sp. RF13]MCY1126931.1 ribose-5-phosphate isomerase RpiA [Frigidibacter sp. RF13]
MPMDLSPSDLAKKAAADAAVAFVQDGMRLGLGTGSTAAFMVKRLGQRVREEGLRVVGVPTSSRTADLARAEGIRVVTLDQAGWLDITIDGADEFDPDLTLIKGGGGAHLQEKVVAAASDRMIVITDPGKRVARLGAFPLPVEALHFGLASTIRHIGAALTDLGYGDTRITRRMAGERPFVSDEGNAILDLHMGTISDASVLSRGLNQIPGVVENGLFINMSDLVVIGHTDGRAELIEAEPGLAELMRDVRPREDNPFADIVG